MTSHAIRVENISKVYRLGAKEVLPDSLFKTLSSMVMSPVRNYSKYKSLYNFYDLDFDNPEANTDPNIIWALRNVSFEVSRGEVVGIIGRNGAGKSTLLKILSKITPPVRGRVEIHGRTSSLLEVGTGFHNELTGRENVYLNGTILGMRKKEVDRRFDEIVEFSGVEKFLDTPVKRYSSGMRVRLAFAVAAHLEPEILIIDEVLAVGDAAFQEKCLKKMENVGSEGRTVFFVSHNMPAVTRLCERIIMLNNGQLMADGPAHEIASLYMHEGSETSTVRSWPDIDKAPGNKVVRLRRVGVKQENNDGDITDAIDIRKPIIIEMEYEVLESGYVLMPNFNLFNDDGVWLFTTLDQDRDWRGRTRPAGRYISAAILPGNLLAEGIVYVTAAMMTPAPFIAHFSERDAVAFEVVEFGNGNSARADWGGAIGGVIRPMLQWTTTVVGSKHIHLAGSSCTYDIGR